MRLQCTAGLLDSDSPPNKPLLYSSVSHQITKETQVQKRQKKMQNYIYSAECYKALEEETFSLSYPNASQDTNQCVLVSGTQSQ